METTRQRIIFVDDEPMVLSGLKRMLRGNRNEWDMDFVDCGGRALEMMEEKPFDVVVADMRMPGMNGAELLKVVMKEHPNTVRLILSGYADQDLVMQSVGSTHQYLAKPCEPSNLKSTIDRAFSLKASLGDSNVFDIVSQMEVVPSLPCLYLQVVEKLRDPETDISEVSEIIRQDIGMTANILKLVNSAFFGSGRKIANVDEAVTQLGMQLLKDLILVAEFFSQYEDDPVVAKAADSLWLHSQEVAGIAKAILECEGASVADKEAVLVAAMLHDLGKLILTVNFPDEYGKLLVRCAEKGESLIRMEKTQFGATHAEVGSYLLGLWGLDEKIVDTIALHHKPDQSVNADFGVLTAIHAANAMANARSKSPDWCGSRKLSKVYLELLGLVERVAVWAKF